MTMDDMMTYPHLHLVSQKLCPYVQRALIVMAERNIPHELEFINMAEKPDWFLKISPLGKIPVLCVDGKPLFESTAIVEYLNDISGGTLHPSDAYERARNRSWVELASAAQGTFGALRTATDEDVFEIHVATLRRRFKSLEPELGDGPWFNGDEFSLVDAAFASLFRHFEVVDRHGELGLFDELPKVNRWRRSLAGRLSVKHAVVDDYCERLYAFLSGTDTVLARHLKRAAARPVES